MSSCFRKFVLLSAVMILILSGCGKETGIPVQMDIPSQSSQDIRFAVIDIRDYGKMRFRLLNEQAPNAVDAFIKLAQEGFYDEKPVYMLINDYCMIAGADSENSLNVSDDAELTDKIYPLRGSLAFTRSVENGQYSASDFTVIQTGPDFLNKLDELLKYKKVTLPEYLKQGYGNEIDEKTLEIFKEYGGAPWLYRHCVVFGQMTDGMEILDRICAVEVFDDAQFRPMEEIVIDSITIE